MSGNKSKVAVLDDWQGVARQSADWFELESRADVTIFADAFRDEDDAAAKLADFDIVLSMRERTPLPGSLINRLPKLRMLGMTGARNASLDTPACTARGIVVCNTQGGGYADSATAELALGLLIAAARGIPKGDENMRARAVPDGRAGRHRPRRQDHRHHRSGPAGRLHGDVLPRAADERDRLEPEPDRGALQGSRRHAGVEGAS